MHFSNFFRLCSLLPTFEPRELCSSHISFTDVRQFSKASRSGPAAHSRRDFSRRHDTRRQRACFFFSARAAVARPHAGALNASNNNTFVVKASLEIPSLFEEFCNLTKSAFKSLTCVAVAIAMQMYVSIASRTTTTIYGAFVIFSTSSVYSLPGLAR